MTTTTTVMELRDINRATAEAMSGGPRMIWPRYAEDHACLPEMLEWLAHRCTGLLVKQWTSDQYHAYTDRGDRQNLVGTGHTVAEAVARLVVEVARNW